jgi:diguanylate cyclase (GGDEF)-like protein
MVALLLTLLCGVIQRRFLKFWSWGWYSLVVASLAESVVYAWPDAGGFPASFRGITAGFFVWLVWAGCRELHRRRPLVTRDGLALAPVVLVGVVGPLLTVSGVMLLSVFHLLVGILAVAAAIEAWWVESPDRSHRLAVRLLASSLALYALTLNIDALIRFLAPVGPLEGSLLTPSLPLAGVLVEFLLGFAMLTVAGDSVRLELVERNRQLANATLELAHAARTDGLTGAMNRKAWEELIEDPDAPLLDGAVGVVDVNDLKPLNDRYGHGAGDRALQAVVKAIHARVRLTDRIFRIGGDEFLILLDGGTANELVRRLELVDVDLSMIRLPGVDKPIRIDIAWGVSEFPCRRDLRRATEAADRAMYLCKAARKGRPDGPDPIAAGVAEFGDH